MTGAYFGSTTFYPSTTLTGSGGGDAFIAKFNSTGALQWAVNSCSEGEGKSIALSGTDIFVAGIYGSGSPVTFGSPTVTATNAGSYDMYVAKYNSSGTGLAVLSAGSTASDVMHNVTTSGTDVYVAGEYQGTVTFGGNTITAAGSYDGMLAKIDGNTMTVSWIRQVRGTGSGECKGVAVRGNAVYVSGEFSSAAVFGDGTTTVNKTSTGSFDVYLEKFDVYGTYQWVSTFGGTNTESNTGAGVDANGHGYVAGHYLGTIVINGTSYSNNGNEDLYAQKFAGSNGAFVRKPQQYSWDEEVTSVSNFASQISIFPNPSNGNLTVVFEEEGPKEIMVYDITGRVINQSTTAERQLNMDISDQPPGLYFLRITCNSKLFTTKLIKE